MVQSKPIRRVVLGILYKELDGKKLILTQLRHVQNPSYDPLYDLTWECMGETLKPGETIIQALLRGLKEETGMEVPETVLMPWSPVIKHTTGRQDYMVFSTPICYMQSMGDPQLWEGPAYLLKVPTDWEPDFSKGDGEASEGKWWDPRDLAEAIGSTPLKFMGLHAPALYHAAQLLS